MQLFLIMNSVSFITEVTFFGTFFKDRENRRLNFSRGPGAEYFFKSGENLFLDWIKSRVFLEYLIFISTPKFSLQKRVCCGLKFSTLRMREPSRCIQV